MPCETSPALLAAREAFASGPTLRGGISRFRIRANTSPFIPTNSNDSTATLAQLVSQGYAATRKNIQLLSPRGWCMPDVLMCKVCPALPPRGDTVHNNEALQAQGDPGGTSCLHTGASHRTCLQSWGKPQKKGAAEGPLTALQQGAWCSPVVNSRMSAHSMARGVQAVGNLQKESSTQQASTVVAVATTGLCCPNIHPHLFLYQA